MLEKIFHLSEKNTNVKTEIIAGITTFLAMAYILGVNPSILGAAEMDVHSVFMATAISAAVASIIMGVVANYPVALAPGMGVNALFTYTVVLGFGYSWQAALASVFVSGIVFILISVTGVRKLIINAIPVQLKLAIGAGIGFFIAFVGLKNAGIVVADASTFVALGDLRNPVVLLAIIGILVTIFMVIKNVPAAVFVGMLFTAALGLVMHEVFGFSVLDSYGGELFPSLPSTFVTTDFSIETLGAFMDGMGELFANPGVAFVIIFSFLFVDFFDTAGTLVAVGNKIGLVNEKGEMEGVEKALLADSVGTVIGAALGTSTVTSFVESSSGVGVGGRTGLTAVVTGLCFLLSIFISPVVLSTAVNAVTAPALVVVGIMMAQQLGGINWDDMVYAASGFVTVVFMILSYSISNGIALGFITYAVSMVAARRMKEVSSVVWVLVFIFIAYFGWLI